MHVFTMSMLQIIQNNQPNNSRIVQVMNQDIFYRNDLTRTYTNLNRLNEDMASSFRIRQQNFAEMQKNLDAVNSVLKSSIRLRGNYHRLI